jgi:hypothetical protein
MLTASLARITFREASKLLHFARKPLTASRSTFIELGTRHHTVAVLFQRTLALTCTRLRSSMADSGDQAAAGGASGADAGGEGAPGGSGEPVVKSAKQLKKDAKKKEKMEKFQQKQAKMAAAAAGQQKQNNSGSEARK